jgi:hypothetical protein
VRKECKRGNFNVSTGPERSKRIELQNKIMAEAREIALIIIELLLYFKLDRG